MRSESKEGGENMMKRFGGISTIAIIAAAMSLSGCLGSITDKLENAANNASNAAGSQSTGTTSTASNTTGGTTGNTNNTGTTSTASNTTGGTTGNTSNTGTTSTANNTSNNTTVAPTGSTPGGNNADRGTLQNVDLVGWGARADNSYGKLNVSLATGSASLRVRTNPDGTTSPVSVTIDGQRFTENCGLAGNASENDYYCENAAGTEEGNVRSLKDNGYNYLHVMEWENKAENRPVAVYIGGKESDRTPPSNVPLSATYSGSAKFEGDFDEDYESQVNMTLRNRNVTGTMTGFREKRTVNGQTVRTNVGGTVNINGSVSGNTLNANITGNFGPHTIGSGRMNGGFFGPNGEEVGGGIAGTTTAGQPFGGAWIAKKQ